MSNIKFSQLKNFDDNRALYFLTFTPLKNDSLQPLIKRMNDIQELGKTIGTFEEKIKACRLRVNELLAKLGSE